MTTLDDRPPETQAPREASGFRNPESVLFVALILAAEGHTADRLLRVLRHSDRMYEEFTEAADLLRVIEGFGFTPEQCREMARTQTVPEYLLAALAAPVPAALNAA